MRQEYYFRIYFYTHNIHLQIHVCFWHFLKPTFVVKQAKEIVLLISPIHIEWKINGSEKKIITNNSVMRHNSGRWNPF